MPVLTIICLVVGGRLVILCYLIIRGGRGGREETLYDRFQQALAGSSRQAAYRAGRAFYRCIKRNRLSSADKQALRNELNNVP